MMQKRGQNRSFSLYNFSSKNRSGLSTTIVTLILILVSLVAVGVIWVVVRNVIQTGTEGVGLSQFSLSAKILDVSIDNSSNNVSLTVKRNAGKGNLTGISFVFSNSNVDTEVITRNVSLKELEQMNFIFHLNMSVSDLTSVSIVPLIKQDEKQITGIALDKYNLGNSKNYIPPQTCIPINCSALGYICGTWNNGTCSGTLNCGNCTGGQTCNASGRCVASCIPSTCASSGYQCGSGYANGTCAGNLNCGNCSGGQICNASGRCVSTGNYTYALSCSQTDVQSAVNNASRGNIVVVPAGNCTWTSTLTITKGITLRGAGISQTKITGQIILVTIFPDNPALSNHETFKVEGFTFNGNNSTSAQMSWQGLITVSGGTTTDYINLIIISNKLQNTFGTGVYLGGTIYGVVASNQFDLIEMPIRSFGRDEQSWAAFYSTLAYGGSDNIYFENNTIGFSSPYSGSPGWLESGQGGRIVVRYNLWNDANTTGSEYWDIHGLQTPNSTGGNCQQYSTMIAEYYGNLRVNTQSAYRAMYLRGGWLMQFNNVITGLGSPSHTFGEYSCDECAAFGVYPQHISNTYFWNNLDDGTIKGLEKQFDACTTYTITENRDYFNYNSSCTSTSCPIGIGCGSTPPTGTCSTGTGYWVTSYSPCYSAPSTMAEMKTITQAGRFYKCTAPNTWTLYYQPYTYPHPLI
jgi:hypothetical protein